MRGCVVAEKFQSNLEIAGSPEIALGLALSVSLGGRALIGLGVPHRITEFSQTPNANDLSLGVRLRVIRSVVKGKQPRPPAKVPKCVLSGKDVELLRQLGCWLRSNHHHLKKCVIAH